jgi:hypothetical protein
MAKTLKTILETYAPRSADEKRFIDKHVVVKHPDRNGNGDEVFKASNIKTVKRAHEHGYDAGKDTAVYEETLDEAILGRFGPRLGKKESEKYPHSAEVLHRYAENNGPGVVGKLRSMGHNFNFERHMPDIEHHPHFRRATEVCDDDNEHHSLHDQMNHPTVQAIVRDTGHTTFQVHDYARRGSFHRRDGHLDFDKYSPTDGPMSPYFDRHPHRRPHEYDVHEEVQQIDEIQGIRFGKRQSQLYPHSAEVLQRHGENNGSIHKGLGIGLPSHGYNIEHHRPDIEMHPRFREAVDVCDEDNPHYSHELKHEIEHPAVQAIARDRGLSSFQAHDYCSRGPFHRRWGHLNFDK